jgi:mono/diheme cytochrome c family protein
VPKRFQYAHALCLVLFGFLVCLSSLGDCQEEKARPANAAEAKFYREKVAPILAASCFSCHGPKSEVKGGLFLGARGDILEGGDSGPAVDLEDPAASLLIDAINYGTNEMPPKQKLPADQIDILTRWVKMGSPIPADAEHTRPTTGKLQPPEVNDETKQFWSFKPVVKPHLPKVEQQAWVGSPIDAFILAPLEAKGIRPNPPASKAELIRRAYYDLTGLPPSLAEVEAFVTDDSVDAFERVIDSLLESKQYGERWGRHWLDLVRYAESNSYERDGEKPHIWRYRDYVIRSFNEDKPYTQFVREQLAGDEFDERTPDSIVATGFYRLGIWDDEPVSQKMALYDDLDDIVLTTSQVFLGMTMNCARCHSHKIDPIPHEDYYRFLAFFNGVRRYGVRSFESVEDASIGPIAVSDAEEHQAELRNNLDRELIQLNRKIQHVERRLDQIMTPPEKEDFKAVEVRVDLARKYAGNGLSRGLADEYVAAVTRKKEIEEQRPDEIAKALVVKEVGATPRETFVLVRGNAESPGEQVEPGFPSILSPPEPVIRQPQSGKSSGRRTALADWIVSPENQMTTRVIANRIWQHHFGRGIVRSPNNFGSAGLKPTHPVLLDWLANRFVEDGWSFKSMHKTIMLSNAYQMSSRGQAGGLEKDPANNLFWRFDVRRLSAEELRDSILAANGSLNLKMGGHSFYPRIPAEVLAGQSRPGNGWGNSSPEERARRAVYIFIKRSLVDPLMADFDFADVDATCPVRFVTNQPTQSLALLNSEFVNRQAAVFASYLESAVGDDSAAQVRLGLTQVTQRRPTQDEVDRGVKFIESLEADNVPADVALRYFCLLTYNLNEFLFLD